MHYCNFFVGKLEKHQVQVLSASEIFIREIDKELGKRERERDRDELGIEKRKLFFCGEIIN